VLVCVVTSAGPVVAGEAADELQELRERVEALEREDKTVDVTDQDGQGHRLHPIHSLGEAKISGGITMIVQGVSSDHLTDPVAGPGDQAEATLSLDLFLEHQISQDGRVLVHLDVQQGAGLTTIPVFAAPNGNSTGTNNDVESFGNDQVHLDQAYYEHVWMGERVAVTLGQYDPTAYFDTNAFANNERFQFMANLFGNNAALEFGGTGNFYGLGGVLRVKPVDWLDLMVGAMEGDGDFVEAFSRPWTIAEADIHANWAGREGNYRFYVWQNRSHHSNLLPGGRDLKNQGIGLNVEQHLSDHLGIWARYGTQKGAVAAFDRSMSGGLHISGGFFGRPHDAIGVGYGLTMISGDYRAAQAAAALPEFDRNEGYFETYYRLVLSGDGETQGFAVSPDIQYITHAGGNSALEPITVYGIRVQAFF
ncbi:MAG: carbohydrate porin, partial [Nitrospiria bacterium]